MKLPKKIKRIQGKVDSLVKKDRRKYGKYRDIIDKSNEEAQKTKKANKDTQEMLTLNGDKFWLDMLKLHEAKLKEETTDTKDIENGFSNDCVLDNSN